MSKNDVQTLGINRKLKRVGKENAARYSVFNQSKHLVHVLAIRPGEKKKVNTTIPPDTVRTFDSRPTVYGEKSDQIICVVSYFD